MDEPKPKPQAGAPPSDREARLAAALRENLRKRKAQARARQDAGPGIAPPAERPDPPEDP